MHGMWRALMCACDVCMMCAWHVVCMACVHDACKTRILRLKFVLWVISMMYICVMQVMRYHIVRSDMLAMVRRDIIRNVSYAPPPPPPPVATGWNTGLILWSETSSDTGRRDVMIFRAPDTSPERAWPEEWLNGPALPAHVHSHWTHLIEAMLRAAARRTANSLRLPDGRRVMGRLGRPVISQVNEWVRGQVWEMFRKKQGLMTILRVPVGPLEGHP